MEHKPDNNRKKKKHPEMDWLGKIVSVVFIAFTLMIALFVYRAINNGIGMPSMRSGIVLADPNATTAPRVTELTTEAPETEPSEESTQPTESTQELTPEALAQQYLAAMTLEEKIWQMFCLSPSQMYYEDGVICPAGAVLFSASDLTSAQTLSQELDKLRADAKTPLLIGTSEEGGASSPLAALGVTGTFDSAAVFGENGDSRMVYEASEALGMQLAAAGFNFNLAPVADTINWYPAGLEGRTYSTDTEVASQMVYNAVSGMQSGGVISCVKHFPNLGSSAPDGNNDVSWRPYTSFQESDFVPFRAGIEVETGMILVSNMMVPDMCGGALMPSCMSANIVTNVLREELGFEGVILSDSQSQQVDTQSVIHIVGAGCDMILQPLNPQACVAALIDAVNEGLITEERINQSVLRILLMKSENNIITE